MPIALLAISDCSIQEGFGKITPVARIGIRAFKQEQSLEVWGAPREFATYRLLGKFKIAGMSGHLGPKRREGDLQVPEGFYFINRFNPRSRFHLSLGLNYPNESDRILGDPNAPGSDIFIHGSNVSVGCLAMTDPIIDVIYPLAAFARDSGQGRIPVQIFPFRMSDAKVKRFESEFSEQPELLKFWRSLQPAYQYFEAHRQWLEPKIGEDGTYLWPQN